MQSCLVWLDTFEVESMMIQRTYYLMGVPMQGPVGEDGRDGGAAGQEKENAKSDFCHDAQRPRTEKSFMVL